MTSIQVQQEQGGFEFPSISICSLDVYSTLKDLIVLPVLETSSIEQPGIAGIMSSAVYTSLVEKYLYSTLYAALDESTKDKAYTPLNETILSCLYNFELCSSSEFTRYLDDAYGPCLKYSPSKLMTKTGSLKGSLLDHLNCLFWSLIWKDYI